MCRSYKKSLEDDPSDLMIEFIKIQVNNARKLENGFDLENDWNIEYAHQSIQIWFRH